MPEQHVVSQFCVERLLLSGSAHLIDVRDRHFAEVPLGVVEVLLHQLVLCVLLVDGLDAAAKLLVVLVQNGLVIVGNLVQQLRGDLQVRNRRKHGQLLLDLFLVVQDEVGHFCKPEVVGNEGVEVSRQLAHGRLVVLLDGCRQLVEHPVGLLDGRLSQPAQRHFLGVVADFLHGVVHDVDVEDQLDQVLQPLVHLRLHLLLGLAPSRCRLLLLLLVVVLDLDLPVVALDRLVVVLARVLSDRCVFGHRPLESILARYPHSSPSVPDEDVPGCLVLKHLHDVEFVVVGVQVALVEGCAVGLVIILQNAVGILVGDQGVDSRSSLCYHLHDLGWLGCYLCDFFGTKILSGGGGCSFGSCGGCGQNGGRLGCFGFGGSGQGLFGCYFRLLGLGFSGHQQKYLYHCGSQP